LYWCESARKKHRLKDSFIRFTDDEARATRWRALLGIEGESRVDDRVWVGHFHDVDFEIEEVSGSQSVGFKSISKGLSKYGNVKKERRTYPNPSASKSDVENSWFTKSETGLFSDYQLRFGASVLRKRKESSADSSNTPRSKGRHGGRRVKSGRKLGSITPLRESFICTSTALCDVIKATDEHARKCEGALHFLRRKITLHGLSLSVKLTCSKGNDCTCFVSDWLGGKKSWNSSRTISIGSKILFSE